MSTTTIPASSCAFGVEVLSSDGSRCVTPAERMGWPLAASLWGVCACVALCLTIYSARRAVQVFSISSNRSEMKASLILVLTSFFLLLGAIDLNSWIGFLPFWFPQLMSDLTTACVYLSGNVVLAEAYFVVVAPQITRHSLFESSQILFRVVSGVVFPLFSLFSSTMPQHFYVFRALKLSCNFILLPIWLVIIYAILTSLRASVAAGKRVDKISATQWPFYEKLVRRRSRPPLIGTVASVVTLLWSVAAVYSQPPLTSRNDTALKELGEDLGSGVASTNVWFSIIIFFVQVGCTIVILAGAQHAPYSQRTGRSRQRAGSISMLSKIAQRRDFRAMWHLFEPLISPLSRAVFVYDITSDVLLAAALFADERGFAIATLSLIAMPYLALTVLFSNSIREQVRIFSERLRLPACVRSLLYAGALLLSLVVWVFCDFALVVIYAFEDVNDTVFIVIYERLRFVSETITESLPQLGVQLALLASSASSVSVALIVATILSSVLSVVRSVLSMRSGARAHRMSTFGYLLALTRGGELRIPHLDSLKRGRANHVAYKHAQLTPLQLSVVLDAVMQCESCLSLDLSFNPDAFASERGRQKLLSHISRNPRLQRLNLKGCQLGRDFVWELVETIVSSEARDVMSDLVLSQNQLESPRALAVLIEQTSLEYISVRGCGLTTEMLEEIVDCVALNTTLLDLVVDAKIPAAVEAEIAANRVLFLDLEKQLQPQTRTSVTSAGGQVGEVVELDRMSSGRADSEQDGDDAKHDEQI